MSVSGVASCAAVTEFFEPAVTEAPSGKAGRRAIALPPQADERPRTSKHDPTDRLKLVAVFNSYRHGPTSKAFVASRESPCKVPK